MFARSARLSVKRRSIRRISRRLGASQLAATAKEGYGGTIRNSPEHDALGWVPVRF